LCSIGGRPGRGVRLDRQLLDGRLDDVREGLLQRADGLLRRDVRVLGAVVGDALDDGVGQDGGGGGAVAGIVRGPGRGVARRLHDDVLDRVLEAERLEDGDAVLRDQVREPEFLLLDQHLPAAGAEGRADRLRDQRHRLA
jgi:hypothetical protein